MRSLTQPSPAPRSRRSPENDYVYLNSGGSGPPPLPVIEAMRATDDLCAGPAYLQGTGLYARQAEAYARAREAAARLVGAVPEDVALTQSTTQGMSLGTYSINWEVRRRGDLHYYRASGLPGAAPRAPGAVRG